MIMIRAALTLLAVAALLPRPMRAGASPRSTAPGV